MRSLPVPMGITATELARGAHHGLQGLSPAALTRWLLDEGFAFLGDDVLVPTRRILALDLAVLDDG